MGGSGGDRLFSDLRKRCEAAGVTGDRPKMGPHGTIIQPFRCTEGELYIAATLMRLVWKLKPGPVHVTARQVAVFEPPEEQSPKTAAYVEFKMDTEYQEFVERHKANWPFPFVHRPASKNPSDRIWIPHMTFMEGHDLDKEMEKLLPDLNDYAHGKQIDLLEPHVLRKQNGESGSWWQKVLV